MGVGARHSIVSFDTNSGSARETLELSVVHGLDGIQHVISVRKIHHAVSALLHIGEDNISGLAHEVLQVLPTATAGEVGHNHSEFGSASTPSTINETILGTTFSTTLVELYPETEPAIVEVIAVTNSLLCISEAIICDESNRRKGVSYLHSDPCYIPVLAK